MTNFVVETIGYFVLGFLAGDLGIFILTGNSVVFGHLFGY